MVASAVAARSRVLARAVSSSLLSRGLLPTSRRASCISRLPLVSGGLLSALPLHSAVASARLRSAIAPESQTWGLVPQVYDFVVKATGEVLAMQLSSEHNVCYEEVRQELQSSHLDDPHIVVLKHNVWSVKGLIQETSCLYDSTNSPFLL